MAYVKVIYSTRSKGKLVENYLLVRVIIYGRLIS